MFINIDFLKETLNLGHINIPTHFITNVIYTIMPGQVAIDKNSLVFERRNAIPTNHLKDDRAGCFCSSLLRTQIRTPHHAFFFFDGSFSLPIFYS